MTTTQYSAPRYYEIAFDMNRKQEVDFLAHCCRRFARRPVKSVLDIACGTGPQLIRIGRRGYRMSGLDRYMCSSWTDPARRWSWTSRRGRATVRATFEALKDLNPVTQTFFEDMELEAHEDGQRDVYRQRHASRMVFPQELRSLVELAGGFELVEWFYGFRPHLKLDRAHHPLLMVVVLRKR